MAKNADPRPLDRLYIDPEGGVAGDMLLAALCDLGADVAAIRGCFDRLGVPGLALSIERVDVDGEAALHVQSIPASPSHHHRRLDEILGLLARAAPNRQAHALAVRVFEVLAEAEAECHGSTPTAVALHEVGALDSILDVLGIAVALDTLGFPAVGCAPLPLGMGTVRTAHGELPLPVPAVRAIAARAGVPTRSVPVVGETVTPTGIAVIAAVCTDFEARPAGVPLAVGVGAGTRRFASRRNVVRIFGYAERREGGE